MAAYFLRGWVGGGGGICSNIFIQQFRTVHCTKRDIVFNLVPNDTSECTSRPTGSFTGNVAVIAVLYVYFTISCLAPSLARSFHSGDDDSY